jgi:hypothetical protein
MTDEAAAEVLRDLAYDPSVISAADRDRVLAIIAGWPAADVQILQGLIDSDPLPLDAQIADFRDQGPQDFGRCGR